MKQDKLTQLKEKNPRIEIFDCSHRKFNRYGKILHGYNFSEYINYARGCDDPKEGVEYLPGIDEMGKMPITKKLREDIYKGSNIQAGWVRGYNNQLNALEYHHASEINIAVTDSLLLLGSVDEMQDYFYRPENVYGFFLPAGAAVELYASTLHFAPIQTEENPFCMIVILPEKTNHPLEDEINLDAKGEERLLFKKYKWLIAHKESPQAETGAFCGLLGEKITISY